jgi:hypothetical protein
VFRRVSSSHALSKGWRPQLGAYPDPSTAARWKKHLREIRAELAAEADPEAG